MVEIIKNNSLSNYWNQEFKTDQKITNLKFIHIGKCGGTSIIYYFLKHGIKLEQYHLVKPVFDEDIKYFMWFRDPIERFISCFNNLKEIVGYQIPAGIKPQDLNLENCPAPGKIIKK